MPTWIGSSGSGGRGSGGQFEADPPLEGAPREEAEEKSEVDMNDKAILCQYLVPADICVRKAILDCKHNMNFSLSHGTKPLARIAVGQNLK